MLKQSIKAIRKLKTAGASNSILLKTKFEMQQFTNNRYLVFHRGFVHADLIFLIHSTESEICRVSFNIILTTENIAPYSTDFQKALLAWNVLLFKAGLQALMKHL